MRPRVGEEDVLGLEVAVNDAVRSVREAGEDTLEHAGHLRQGRTRPTSLRSEPPSHVLHRD